MYYASSTRGFYAAGQDRPSDAVEISAETHVALLDAQSSGKQIVADENGYPIVVDPPLPALGAVKSSLSARIDAAAETIRAKYITTGAGQAMAYLEKASQAKAYLAATDPVDADYPLLAAEVGITGETVAEVATVIDTMQQQWVAICAQIEPIRIGAKEQIKAADTVEDAQAIYDAIEWPSEAE